MYSTYTIWAWISLTDNSFRTIIRLSVLGRTRGVLLESISMSSFSKIHVAPWIFYFLYHVYMGYQELNISLVANHIGIGPEDESRQCRRQIEADICASWGPGLDCAPSCLIAYYCALSYLIACYHASSCSTACNKLVLLLIVVPSSSSGTSPHR